jgi:hypothetical protein
MLVLHQNSFTYSTDILGRHLGSFQSVNLIPVVFSHNRFQYSSEVMGFDFIPEAMLLTATMELSQPALSENWDSEEDQFWDNM